MRRAKTLIADAISDFSLCWAHMSEAIYCHAAAQMQYMFPQSLTRIFHVCFRGVTRCMYCVGEYGKKKSDRRCKLDLIGYVCVMTALYLFVPAVLCSQHY